ncbi:UDP-N-acetylmuramoyl-tripeptide--D-alanyl-D-alanine ligase [Ktedonobacter racemifer]|uniref:UDP-N-acetylmuramoyl-tripeptide--D-alanyl-D-alanine ligase n=1 Tax=Ktedonobacter racemifer DSM 44963 TaxID=485913 RepID=D6U6C3_KTERA|nr:UDP-N-acetylmuramoyl-tripeptide--D-alanyl-D-alanine ligase [Ktedonobacter racemifer]EFH80534.1 UDP-N-acetylmuramoylalanyl-D-glutamyl-2,6-diamin opimelate/D-alanyl-D-alanylligase [Ktedonobacter racemifer DSM 44963]
MFTLQDVIAGSQELLSMHGSLADPGHLLFQCAQHDSRQYERDDLFVAITGARVDGHRFIPAIARAGGAGALCTTLSEDVPAGFLQLVVPDVVKALQATARVRVQRQPETLKIGITGSSGKTTTKEAIAAVLGRVAPTLKTYASYNNELGYPLTLLRLEAEHRYAVLEMGAEWVGELRGLCETIACPDWSVITTVGAAHLKHFGSLANVAIAKSELVQVLSPEGIAFLNYDDPVVRAMKEKTRARVIYYGQGDGAAVRALHVEERGLLGSRFTLRIEDEDVPVQLRLPGTHGITTALAAAAVGSAANIPLESIRESLEALSPVQGRGVVKGGAGPNGSTLIDDTYNAIRHSIIAMAQAMQATTIAPQGKRWVVLGELFEQGEHTRDEHLASGLGLAGKVDYLVVLGDNARYYMEGALQAGMPRKAIYHFSVDTTKSTDVEEGKRAIASLLKEKVTPDDLLLIKGSRQMRMETMLSMF